MNTSLDGANNSPFSRSFSKRGTNAAATGGGGAGAATPKDEEEKSEEK